MRTRFLKVSLLCALFATGVFVTGCSDDNGYSDVDGESPVAVLKTNHIQSGAGHDFTIEGTLTDADGISAISTVDAPEAFCVSAVKSEIILFRRF